MDTLLFNALSGVEKNEWQAFLEGRVITPTLLIKLLHYRYREQRDVFINPRPIHLQALTEFSSIDAQTNELYEINVVIRHYTENPLTTLLVKRRERSPIVLVIRQDEELPEMIYVFNNHYVEGQDNAYYSFDFLDFVFQNRPTANTILYQDKNSEVTTSTLATKIIQELTQFLRIRENLVLLYKELNTLLIELSNNRENNPIRQTVEYKKQLFNLWTLSTFKQFTESIEVPSPESLCFLKAQFKGKDPIPVTHIDTTNLFKEMIGLIRFFLEVGQTSDSKRNQTVNIEIGNSFYDTAAVASHIQSLLSLIMQRIDELNVPPFTPEMSRAIGFTEQDYLRILNERVLPASIILLYLKRLLHPESLILTERSEASLTQIQKNRLIFWLFEEKAYTALMLLQLPEKLNIWQRGLYVPSYKTEDVEEIRLRSNQLLKRYNLTSYRLQFDTHEGDYSLSSWYTMLIIMKISERLANEPLNTDWVAEMKSIIDGISIARIKSTIKQVTYTLQSKMLKFAFTQEQCPITIVASQPDIMISNITTIALYSQVSDIAKLSMDNQYIDDSPITDAITAMPKSEGCHIFDSDYWGSMISTKKIRPNKVFSREDITLFIMPLNQENEHWALAIIDRCELNVGYYSSIRNDSYFNKPFLKFMSQFLAIQTPGLKYDIVRLEGLTQPMSSFDCALFMLSRISQVCSPKEQRIKYTRESMATDILKRLIEVLKEANDLSLFVKDVYQRYIHLPIEWRDISGRRDNTHKYRKRYIAYLRRLLYGSDLFTRESVDTLTALLSESYAELDSLESVSTLFQDTLKERCSNYDTDIEHTISRLIRELLQLKSETPEGKAVLQKRYGMYIYNTLLPSLVSEVKVRHAFLNDLLDALYFKEENEAIVKGLRSVIDVYVECEEENEQIVIY